MNYTLPWQAALDCLLRLSGFTMRASLSRIRQLWSRWAIFTIHNLIALLQVFHVRASMLIGILGTALTGWTFSLVRWQPQSYHFSDITATALKLDIRGALHVGALEIIFVFLFVDLFDNIGTLVAVSKKAGLIDANHHIPRLNRIFFADATATIAGSLTGTSTVVSYIESSAGVAAGGRTGVTAIVTGLLFLVTLFIAPLVGAIPIAATSPALIVVGGLMLSSISDIKWSDPLVAFPAFLTLVTIPLTYSIANGLSFGIVSFALLRIFSGRFRKEEWMLYLLAALFLLRFFYLSKG
jgi:AGZA family xanthine/uracil permease-like MFS transporter